MIQYVRVKKMAKKVILITGSSSGIGKSTAIKYAQNNYNVIINYNSNYESANKLKNELENKYNIKCLTIKADVSNDDEVKDMFDRIINTFNRIDVVVNNAGITNDSLVEDKKKEDFLKIFEVNTYGVFLVSKTFVKYMNENHGGCIINIASTNGIDTTYPESLDYDASKAGVISLTHNLALQFKPFVNVNAIAPGYTMTDMLKTVPEDLLEKFKAIEPSGSAYAPKSVIKIFNILSSSFSMHKIKISVSRPAG